MNMLRVYNITRMRGAGGVNAMEVSKPHMKQLQIGLKV
jgi:hypothetical protein